MALIKCNACGNFVSDRAFKCPKCGFPIVKNKIVLQEKPEPQQLHPPKKNASNKVWITIFVCSVLAFVGYVGYKTVLELEKRENVITETYRADAQAEKERQDILNTERNEQLKKITPDLFFYDKSKGGQLRQDLVQNLRKLGFDSDNGKVFTLFSSDKAPIISVTLDHYNQEYSAYGENTQKVSINILNEPVKKDFVDNFRAELEKNGFVFNGRKNDLTSSRPYRPEEVYMRIRKEINRKNYFGDHFLAQWDAVDCKGYMGGDIVCMSKDEIKEDDLK